MKFSRLTTANLAKAANPVSSDEQVSKISNFSSEQTLENGPQETMARFGAGNAANPANPADGNPSISSLSNFSNGYTGQNSNFSQVRCCDCRHSTPALPGSAVSWHVCAIPDRSRWHGWWGLSEHCCEAWEAQQDRRQAAGTDSADRWQA